MHQPKFELGEVVTSPGFDMNVVLEDARAALRKHEAADWDENCAEDKRANEVALRCGLSIWTVHRDRNNVLFWIITEADRTFTTMMLPSEGNAR